MTDFDLYHDFAARLLGKDYFPLPLPNWDRDYPHNVGLLSDAEESALAAAVLQFTQGMSLDNWRQLELEQRLPWMRHAVEKMETNKVRPRMNRADVVADLLVRARANLPTVTADDVATWPNGLIDELVADGVLTPTDNARSVTCDACGDDHVEEVTFVESPPGSEMRAYIGCPESGRVRVPLDRLRRWTINPDAIRESVGDESFHPGSSLPENVTVEMTYSTEFLPTPQANDPKGLRDAAEYCRAWAAKLGDARAKWWWTQALVFDADAANAEKQSVAPESPEGQAASTDRVWPDPESHTTAKVWTRTDGVLCLSTKTDGGHDGQVEFVPNASGELTYQMRLMQVMCFKFPGTATLAEIIKQVYSDEYAEASRDPATLTKTLRKLRSLVSDVRTKKLTKAGLHPHFLPPLSVEASINTGIGLRLAKLHRLDDKELDDADAAAG